MLASRFPILLLFALPVLVLGGCDSLQSERSGESADESASADVETCLTEDEQQLLSLIRDYREENGLDQIPVSRSLTKVARVHMRDLANNEPHKKREECNGHSWSDEGDWTPCCYTPDHAEAECMWDKPREITPYEGNGFEIGTSGPLVEDPEDALSGWQSSPPHNAVILNEGDWSDYKWKSIGVGIYKGYAAAWFGKKSDPTEGAPPSCDE